MNWFFYLHVIWQRNSHKKYEKSPSENPIAITGISWAKLGLPADSQQTPSGLPLASHWPPIGLPAASQLIPTGLPPDSQPIPSRLPADSHWTPTRLPAKWTPLQSPNRSQFGELIWRALQERPFFETPSRLPVDSQQPPSRFPTDPYHSPTGLTPNDSC